MGRNNTFSFHRRRCLFLPLLAVFLSRPGWAQRQGGEVRRRKDDQGRTYFEVFADHLSGNLAEPAPMRMEQGGARWPRRVSVRAESFWMIATGENGKVDANGIPATGKPLVAPGLPQGALIARWTTLDLTQHPVLLSGVKTTPISDWLMCGRNREIEVPIPAKVHPSPYIPNWLGALARLDPQQEFQYTPLVALQYQCNDELGGFGNNDGWLHVYQTWIW